MAKDAISNLRTSFGDSDPNQHILDTLEQCISVIIEKMQNLDQHEKSNSRMSSIDYARVNDNGKNSFPKLPVIAPIKQSRLLRRV